MPMTIYKMFANTAGDSQASSDVQLDGTIRAMLMSARFDGCDGLNDGGQAECSFLSTNSFAANDVRGSLMMLQSTSGMLTSGMLQTAMNIDISSLEIPVNAGERIHLHTALFGGATAIEVHVYLYVLDRGVARTAARRR